MKKIITTHLFVLIGFLAKGQTNETKLKVSGTVDTYYSTNLFTSSLGTNGVLSDVKANGFGLGMINTVFTYEQSKTGIVADLAYGPRANAANAYNGAINQLYVYYQPTEKLKLTLGQFNTFYGYEVISPEVNFNYTVSNLFGAGPFSHSGLRVDYFHSDDVNFMVSVTNPHGITSGSNTTTDEYQIGFQFGYKNQYLNLIYGADGFGFQDVLYFDYTGGYDFSDTFYLGINAAYSNSKDADTGYRGIALYFQKEFSKVFSAGFRPEYFKTSSNNVETSISAFTFTGNTHLSKNLKLTAELRYDTSKDIVLISGKDDVTGFTLASIYTF